MPEILKIGLVGDLLGVDGKGSGGVARVVIQLAYAYARAGQRVWLFYPRRRHAQLNIELDADLKLAGVETLAFGSRRGPKFLAISSLDALDLARKMKSLRIQVAHVHGAASWGIYLSLPWLFTVHGRIDRDLRLRHEKSVTAGLVARWIWAIERIARKRAVAITVQTRHGERLFELMSPSEIVPNPVDEIFFRASRRPFPARQILIVARFSPEKGVLEAIEWFSDVKSRGLLGNVELRIIGAAEDQGYLEACRALATGRSDISIVVGGSPSEVADAMSQASLLMVSSRHENAPLVVAEALVVGLPVMARNVGAISEMIDGLESCYVYDDPTGPSAEVVEKLIQGSNSAGVDELQLRSTRSKYSIENIADRMLALLGSALILRKA